MTGGLKNEAPGKDRVVWWGIERFEKIDNALIHEQVEIIKPTLIVCGGTFKHLCHGLQLPCAKEDKRKTWKNSLLVGVRHPDRANKRDYFRDVVTLAYQ